MASHENKSKISIKVTPGFTKIELLEHYHIDEKFKHSSVMQYLQIVRGLTWP